MKKIRIPNENDREMVRLSEEGMSLRAIANQFGSTKETVRQRINRLKRLERKSVERRESK